jgi:putative hemolysin
MYLSSIETHQSASRTVQDSKSTSRCASLAPNALEQQGFFVSWAKHLDEVREAQRLRYNVFTQDMGSVLKTSVAGYDVDLYDDFCEHLLVRDTATGMVIGTYRVLTPAQAKRIGGLYAELEFDLIRLRSLRPRIAEFGRSCVHPQHRHGGVMLALWGALIAFVERNNLDVMLGCASIPLTQAGQPTGLLAVNVWRQLSQKHLAPIEHHVLPRLALPVRGLHDPWPKDVPAGLPVSAPPLIKGYLRLGAKVLGPPAWDPDFNCADLPMMMRLADLPERYRRHFQGQQTGGV